MCDDNKNGRNGQSTQATGYATEVVDAAIEWTKWTTRNTNGDFENHPESARELLRPHKGKFEGPLIETSARILASEVSLLREENKVLRVFAGSVMGAMHELDAAMERLGCDDAELTNITHCVREDADEAMRHNAPMTDGPKPKASADQNAPAGPFGPASGSPTRLLAAAKALLRGMGSLRHPDGYYTLKETGHFQVLQDAVDRYESENAKLSDGGEVQNG